MLLCKRVQETRFSYHCSNETAERTKNRQSWKKVKTANSKSAFKLLIKLTQTQQGHQSATILFIWAC